MTKSEIITGSNSDVEVIVRDTLCVEDVYEHLLYDTIFSLLGGESSANIQGIPDEFVEELRWRST